MICDIDGYPVELEVKILRFALNAGDSLFTRKEFNKKVRGFWGKQGYDRAQLFWRNRFFRVGQLGGTLLTHKGIVYYNNMSEELSKLIATREKTEGA